MSSVVVVGSYNQDHVWVSDELPQPGATRSGRYLSGPGGKGFNQAVACARSGATTGFLVGLGEDAAAVYGGYALFQVYRIIRTFSVGAALRGAEPF